VGCKMAKQAAKKAAKASAEVGQRLKIQIAVINVSYIVFKMIIGRSTFGGRDVLGFLFLALCSFVSYSGQVSCAGTPGAGELDVDLYILTFLAQLITCFTNYGFLVFLAIPAYALYYFGQGLLGRTSGQPNQGSSTSISAEEKKRLAKKEKKAQRNSMRVRR